MSTSEIKNVCNGKIRTGHPVKQEEKNEVMSNSI
jgi:hypothetical protein